jgi:hypothetical protein
MVGMKPTSVVMDVSQGDCFGMGLGPPDTPKHVCSKEINPKNCLVNKIMRWLKKIAARPPGLMLLDTGYRSVILNEHMGSNYLQLQSFHFGRRGLVVPGTF